MMSIKGHTPRPKGSQSPSVNNGSGRSACRRRLVTQSAAALSGTPRLSAFPASTHFPEVLWLAQRARQAWDGVRHRHRECDGNTELRAHPAPKYDCFDYVVVGNGEVIAFTKLAFGPGE